jgi:hypothetical protein
MALPDSQNATSGSNVLQTRFMFFLPSFVIVLSELSNSLIFLQEERVAQTQSSAFRTLRLFPQENRRVSKSETLRYP